MTAAKKETLRWGVGMRADAESAREKILDAALSCYQKYTLEETCMKLIAQEAKVTRQTIYRHFPSRDDIVLNLIIRDLNTVLDTIYDQIPTEYSFAEFVVETLAVVDEKIRQSPIFELIVRESAMLMERIQGYGTQIVAVSGVYFRDRFNAAKSAGELLPHVEYDEFVSWLYHVGASFILLPPDAQMSGGIRPILWRYLIPAIVRAEAIPTLAPAAKKAGLRLPSSEPSQIQELSNFR